eukprot:scaffold620_cov169-Amphora_coffeaeformis.AAC.15
MKPITTMFLLASATSVFGAAVAPNVSEACRSFNLTFDATRGVPEPEVRGLILAPMFYESIGINNLTCVRSTPRDPTKSVCRLFDTSVPVGYWNESCADFGCECDCAPPSCNPTLCGDPDLASATEGMVLIIEERSSRRAPAYPPDDNYRGGSILVEFSSPTTVISIGFMDIEEPTPAIMEFRHANGAIQVIGPVTGDNGHAIESIMIDGVISFTITFVGSGAISSLQYTQNCATAQSGGDPHFKRFRAPRRQTFHGECDLVMLKSPLLDLHIRTTIAQHYSFIELAAMKIGERILEISAGNPNLVLLDGQVHSVNDSKPFVFASVYKNTTYKYYKADALLESKSYILEITPWVFVRVKMHAEFLTVSVHGDGDLEGAVGLLGRFPDGALVTRSGEVVTIPFVEFAAEWQVNPDDGILFKESRSPQLPYERCRMPSTPRPSRRMLRFSAGGLYQQALEACRQVDYFAEDIDLCIDDILATGDVGLANIW